MNYFDSNRKKSEQIFLRGRQYGICMCQCHQRSL